MRQFKCFLLAMLLLLLLLVPINMLADPELEKPWYLTVPKKLVGELILYEGEEEKELVVKIFRFKNKDHSYLVKISRNSVDSKFMAKNSAVGGWIDIPVPLVFISYIRKRHSIRYIGADSDWNYFSLLLE